MIINGPRRSHGNDRVEICRVWKLDLNIGREETIFPHYLVHHEVETAIEQPLSYEARSANVIMLNKQGAHGLSVIWILTIGSLQPVVRSAARTLSFVSKQC